MPEQQFKASLSRSQGRSAWCVIFRHPLRRDPHGRTGLKVRRGLGTTDRVEAERLNNQMNALLSNPEWWMPTAREKAERIYDQRIVNAFYDHLTPSEYNFWEIRERVIPLPTPDDEYTRVLFVGTTGAGKTTLVRQLLDTDPLTERFPSTSAAKTTICDIEMVFARGPFRAVVSFLPRDWIQIYVEESIIAAVLASLNQKEPQDIARKLLEHNDQRFRLSYILGNWPSPRQDKDTIDEDEEDETSEAYDQEDEVIGAEEHQRNVETLHKYVNHIQSLAAIVWRDLENHPKFPHGVVSKEERDASVQELLEKEIYQYEAFQQLMDDIMDDIEVRFNLLEKSHITVEQGGWPSYWEFETKDRADFLKTINWFSSNYAPLFGRLLTPLVQGIRVAGPFQPEWREGPAPRLVLMDGEGLGHNSDTATSLSTRITTRFDNADAIVLVDNASQPLQAAPTGALKSIATSGHVTKIFICFTHFDAVKGDNLPDYNTKRNHVLNSLDNVITSIGKEVGLRTSATLKNTLNDRMFFVSNIQNRLSSKAKGTRTELNKMIEALEALRMLPTPTEIHPVYDGTYLLLFIQRAVKSFHEAWRGRLGLTTQSTKYPEHWTRIKALSRRVARQGSDEYGTLKPVADFIREFNEQIRLFLENPEKWTPYGNENEEMQQAVIDAITRDIYLQLHRLARKRLIQEQTPNWETAYSRWGTGSTKVRAHDIDMIYKLAVPIFDDISDYTTDEFLDTVIQIVRNAVRERGGKFYS